MYSQIDRFVVVSVFRKIYKKCYKVLGNQPSMMLYNTDVSPVPSKEEVEKRFSYEMKWIKCRIEDNIDYAYERMIKFCSMSTKPIRS